MCAFVYIYIYKYVCVCVFIYICIYTRVCACLCERVRVRVSSSIGVCMCDLLLCTVDELVLVGSLPAGTDPVVLPEDPGVFVELLEGEITETLGSTSNPMLTGKQALKRNTPEERPAG